jgi:hypothetical protein
MTLLEKLWLQVLNHELLGIKKPLTPKAGEVAFYPKGDAIHTHKW